MNAWQSLKHKNDGGVLRESEGGGEEEEEGEGEEEGLEGESHGYCCCV